MFIEWVLEQISKSKLHYNLDVNKKVKTIKICSKITDKKPTKTNFKKTLSLSY